MPNHNEAPNPIPSPSELMNRFGNEVLNNKNLSAIDEIAAEDYVELDLPQENLAGPILWPRRSGRIDGLVRRGRMPATERTLPGLDGPSVDEEIRRWNEGSPRYGLRLAGPPNPSET